MRRSGFAFIGKSPRDWVPFIPDEESDDPLGWRVQATVASERGFTKESAIQVSWKGAGPADSMTMFWVSRVILTASPAAEISLTAKSGKARAWTGFVHCRIS